MIWVIAAASFLSAPLAAVNADPHLGMAVSANMAAMIVPPRPHGPAFEGGDGVLGVAAIRRLQTDKVKVSPAPVTTPVSAGN